MDAKERLEKMITIAKQKRKILLSIGDNDGAYNWNYVYILLTDDSWLNERYDFYTLTDEEFEEKYPQLAD